eukprot:685626-Pleurochrysis_carterae.AAC.2
MRRLRANACPCTRSISPLPGCACLAACERVDVVRIADVRGLEQGCSAHATQACRHAGVTERASRTRPSVAHATERRVCERAWVNASCARLLVRVWRAVRAVCDRPLVRRLPARAHWRPWRAWTFKPHSCKPHSCIHV